MAEGITLYFVPVAQPSRAVWLFLKMIDIPFTEKEIDFSKDEHQTPEFLAMNPFHTVPVLTDSDLTIVESVASAKYLANTKNVPDHWYPKDPKKRVKVDEYLAWQHTGIRAAGVNVAMSFVFTELSSGKPVPEEDKEAALKGFDEKLTGFESYFLKDKPFIVGDEISIADLFAISEIEQAVLSKADYLRDHPKTRAWIERVKSKTSPHYEIVFKALGDFAASL